MRTIMKILLVAAFPVIVACGGQGAPAPSQPAPMVSTSSMSPPMVTSPGDAGALDAQAPISATARSIEVKSLPLTGAAAPLFLDYIAQDHGRVWIPFVAKDGMVAVFDAARGDFTNITGFKVVERDSHGKTRAMGPSSVTIGDGVAYVGNRGTAEICVVDGAKLKVGKCLKLATAPDGVAYVAATHEAWVTTPGDHSITILDASKKETLKAKTILKVDGDPEGYAVSGDGSAFFTNLEDKNRTLKIDTKTHQVTATWSPGCGADGPRGLAFDSARGFLVVACTDHLQVLDAAHDGAPLGKIDTGAGVDNIDFAESLVYAAAGKAAKMTIARIDDRGTLSLVASGPTADGARNAVAGADGKAYVVDGKNAQLLVLQPSATAQQP